MYMSVFICMLLTVAPFNMLLAVPNGSSFEVNYKDGKWSWQ